MSNRADFHKGQATIACKLARDCGAEHKSRANRAYWQSMAAYHREAYARLMQEQSK